jgi:membrane-bound inhibitor of C-type lysozyme
MRIAVLGVVSAWRLLLGRWKGHPGSAALGCPVLKEVGGAALLVLLPLLPAVVAVPAMAVEPEAAIRVTYLCQGRFDAVRLTALFFNAKPREVLLLQGEQATRLPQQPSGSGARYGAGNQSFWLKGDQATWQFGAGATYSCGPESVGPAGAVKRR